MVSHRITVVLLAPIIGLSVGVFAEGATGPAGSEGDRESEIRADYVSGPSWAEVPLWSRDEVIVKFLPDVPLETARELVEKHRCHVLRSCAPGDFHLVRIPPGETPEHMVQRFSQCDIVEYAECNYHVVASLVPNDSYFDFQWNLDNPVTGGMRMEAAWDIQRADPNVIVAVLDTGVAYEDFGVYRRAPDFNDALFVPGYDFVNDDDHPNDDEGHGTHVAGTIAQSTDNGLGVAGVAFGCSLMPVKVLDEEGLGEHFTIAEGILFAAENGAQVINMSFGSPSRSRTLENAAAAAYHRGVTIVCAAGNDFFSGNQPNYPASYDAYCIAVGAVRYDLSRAPYSNTGSHLDVVAPGGDLDVDQNGDGFGDGILQQTFVGDPNEFAYWFFQGTSMASPHVAGLAALLVSRGVTDPDQVREAIEMTARDLGSPGKDREYGWGFIDAEAALAYYIVGDFNQDNTVDTHDLSFFTSQWLLSEVGLAADLNADWLVDFQDFGRMARDWRR
ncbi:MAG: S8 family serine peptidase [Sedimentisphaerales bacterium]|nr:S8 family serine peptidase [Sedimentisphaerales bacterium]